MSNRSNSLGRVIAFTMRRPNRYWLIAALVVALLYYGWGQVMQRRGHQVMAFRPAAQSCGSDGPLRYCIYRDRRGTNGDVLYHLHGRNAAHNPLMAMPLGNDAVVHAAVPGAQCITGDWWDRLDVGAGISPATWISSEACALHRGAADARNGPGRGDPGQAGAHDHQRQGGAVPA